MDRKPGQLTKNVQDAVNSLVWIKVGTKYELANFLAVFTNLKMQLSVRAHIVG